MEPTDPTAQRAAQGAEDGRLVRCVLGGDKQAFDKLVSHYQKQAFAVAYRLLGNSNDALEVTQEAFLKAFRSLDTLQKPEAFGGWLMRIVSNLSLNYRRGRKIRQQASLDGLHGISQSDTDDTGAAGEWMSKDADPRHTLESREMGAKLQWALQQLPEKQRMAIVLFTIEEMPQKQVAEALECSVEAVKWHVFQGRKRLKDLLKDVL